MKKNVEMNASILRSFDEQVHKQFLDQLRTDSLEYWVCFLSIQARAMDLRDSRFVYYYTYLLVI